MSKNKGSGWGFRLGLGLVVIGVAWAWLGKKADQPGSVVHTAVHDVWPVLRWWLLAALVLAVLAPVVAFVRRRSPSALINRSKRKSNQHGGLASPWDVLRRASVWRLRQRAGVLRPATYGAARWWTRLRIPGQQLGFRVCRIGLQWLWVNVESFALFVGPIRSGKTGQLANMIVDAPGAVLATTTKPDLLDLTMSARAEVGPVQIFNPEQVGGPQHQGTIRWNPLVGCKDWMTARRRALAMMSGAPGARNVGATDFWEGRAVFLLARLLHAAALVGGNMRTVQHWQQNIKDTQREVTDALAMSQYGSSLASEHMKFISINDNTRTSIEASLEPALEWMHNPAVAEVVTGSLDQQFDIAESLARRGTLYLLASEEGSAAPLFTALVDYIHSEAKLLSTRAPGGRLDPPFSLILDEIVRVCPVPLAEWSSDSTGRGIPMAVGIQSRAQLRWKWGEDAARVIWGNSISKFIFGGCDDEEDLKAYSDLVGHREERIVTEDAGGSKTGATYNLRPIMSMAEIRSLPDWHVLVLQRGLRASVGVVRPIWKRRELRKLEKRASKKREQLAKLAAAVDESMASVTVPAQPSAPAAEQTSTAVSD